MPPVFCIKNARILHDSHWWCSIHVDGLSVRSAAHFATSGAENSVHAHLDDCRVVDGADEERGLVRLIGRYRVRLQDEHVREHRDALKQAQRS